MLQKVLKYFGYVPEPMPQSKPRKYRTKRKRGGIAAAYMPEAKTLKIGGSFIIDNPVMAKSHALNGKQYAVDYVSNLNNNLAPKKFSQMTYQGKAIVTRIK